MKVKKTMIWEKILKGEKIISEKEAEELEESVNSIRKERRFRLN